VPTLDGSGMYFKRLTRSCHSPRRGSRGFANADYGNPMKIPLGFARRYRNRLRNGAADLGIGGLEPPPVDRTASHHNVYLTYLLADMQDKK
jgi:hypothetical protein